MFVDQLQLWLSDNNNEPICSFGLMLLLPRGTFFFLKSDRLREYLGLFQILRDFSEELPGIL